MMRKSSTSWDETGTCREPEAEKELTIGGIDSEAETNEDEGSKDGYEGPRA